MSAPKARSTSSVNISELSDGFSSSPEDGLFEGTRIQTGEDALEIQVVLLPSDEPEPSTSLNPIRELQPTIPVDLLEKLLELVENLPETSQQLAEARERAARAEERYAFELERRQLLEERVTQLEKELEHNRSAEKREKRGRSRSHGRRKHRRGFRFRPVLPTRQLNPSSNSSGPYSTRPRVARPSRPGSEELAPDD